MGDGSVHIAARPALLGRSDELAELRLGLADARSGRGRLFLIAGEAGIGKTRLVEALAEEAAPTEAVVAWGRCWEGGGAPAFWPWVQVVRACAADTSDDILLRRFGEGARDVAQLVPELAERLPGVAPAPPSETPGARARLFDSVLGFLSNVAADGGLVIALDDLHAADEASLRLLHHVAGHLDPGHLLVVGTYRDAEARSSRQLHRLLTAIARHGRRLVLAGLAEPEVAVLVERSLGVGTSDSLVRSVFLATDGNPFFVHEALRLLGTEPGADAVVLPEEVHALVRRRLEPVSAPVRGVLAAASVLGREFDLPALARLSATPAEGLFDVLDEARRLGVLEEIGLGRWRFGHALLREALYDALRPSERVTLHRGAGESLEDLTASGGDARTAELASHFFEAARGGDGPKAAHYCALAGQEAMGVLAFEEAALQFSRALEALALEVPVDERRRCELLVALGQALFRGGDLGASREAYRRALRAARAAGSPELLAEAAVGFAGLPEATVDHVTRSVLDEARAALPPHDSALLARVTIALAAVTPEPASTEVSNAAVEMARRVGDRDALQQVLWSWFLLSGWSPPLPERRLAVAEELLGMATDAGDRERAQFARQWRAAARFELGDVAGARSDLDVALRDAVSLRVPFLVWGATFPRAALALLEGRLGDADRLAHEALTIGERSEYLDVGGTFRNQLWALRREQGRFEEMLDIVRRHIGEGPAGRTDLGRLALALSLVEAGDADGARRTLEPVTALLAAPLFRNLLAQAMLAEVLWHLEEPTHAERVYGALLGRAGHHVTSFVFNFSWGACDRYLGQMATLLGRHDDAERHFEDAHRLHEQLGAPGWLAHGRLDQARMLLRRGGPEDRRRAVELARQAEEAYRSLGMTVHAERAAALPGSGAGAPATAAERGTFRLEGEYWALGYGGAQARLRDSKGLRYLGRLLASPGQELHALDLVVGEGTGGRRTTAAATRDAGLELGGGGDAGAVLDARAKAAYKRRVLELREEIEEATANADAGRLAKAQDEMDFLLAELSAAVGLGGRDRKAASDAEKARQSVTRAIRGAIDRVGEAHPTLGEHLRATVRTGVYTSYSPDPRAPIEWSVSTR